MTQIKVITEENFRTGNIIERINLKLSVNKKELDFLLTELNNLRTEIEKKRKTCPIPEFGDRDIIKYHRMIEQLDPNNKFKSIGEVLDYTKNYIKDYLDKI